MYNIFSKLQCYWHHEPLLLLTTSLVCAPALLCQAHKGEEIQISSPQKKKKVAAKLEGFSCIHPLIRIIIYRRLFSICWECKEIQTSWISSFQHWVPVHWHSEEKQLPHYTHASILTQTDYASPWDKLKGDAPLNSHTVGVQYTMQST